MRPVAASRRRSRTAVLALVALAASAGLAGCSGKGGAHAAHRATATPAQPLAAAPDPKSITVPSAAAPSGPASTAPAPKGPTADLTAQQIWDRAAAVMKAQKSVAVTIDTVTDDGDSAHVHATSVVSGDGDCVGAFTESGGHAQVIHVGPSSYLKGDRALWENGAGGSLAELAPMAAGHWITGSMAQLGTFGAGTMCDLGLTVEDASSDFGGSKSKGVPLTLDGHRVIPVEQTSDNGTVTLYVSATGPATVLKSTRTDDGPTTIRFTAFGPSVHAKTPAGVLG